MSQPDLSDSYYVTTSALASVLCYCRTYRVKCISFVFICISVLQGVYVLFTVNTSQFRYELHPISVS